jgi:hypothetical protein
MRLYEIDGTKFDPLLVEFWRQATPQDLNYYFVQDNCYGASQAFNEFLESRGIGNAEIVPIGRVNNGRKQFGWFYADEPDLHIDALETKDKLAMKHQGSDPRKKPDRIKYINSDPAILEEFRWIPHSWVELRGQILDPSGFYIDGRSGQFDRMVHNKSNLAQRYRYF